MAGRYPPPFLRGKSGFDTDSAQFPWKVFETAGIQVVMVELHGTHLSPDRGPISLGLFLLADFLVGHFYDSS